MPAGMTTDWNNKAEVMWTFLAHYYCEEGIVATSELARDVELYVFHGTYTYKRSINKTRKLMERPIVHGLHFKLTNNRSLVVMTAHLLYSLILNAWCCRSRFAANVTTNFVSFLELYSKHPEWKQFFDDKGEGMAPLDFMIAIEKGLRAYSSDKFAMGDNPLCTRERWVTVPVWRKCEAYITLIRHIRNHFSYPK